MIRKSDVTGEVGRARTTPETLAPLIERYGDRWNIWPSAQGAYACATLRRGLSWLHPQGRHPVGVGGAYVCSLVTDSPEELLEAIEVENEKIAAWLADGTLTKDA